MRILAEVRRAGRLESTHWGWAIAVRSDGSRLLEVEGAPSIYARSAAKPFQALPLVQSGAFDALGLDEAHLAVCCASHAAEPAHLDAVRRVLASAGVSQDALGCGPQAPLSDPCAEASALTNNCSGKHSGMLATCAHMGWPLETYRDPAHPLQRAIAAALEELGDCRLDRGIDGCGVPAWYLPLRSLALAFARLPGDPAGRRIASAMAAHPVMVSGTDRRDTRLMQATGGRIVSKGGAEGVSAGCVPELGLGFALKIADGNARAVGPALVALLTELGLLDYRERLELADLAHPPVRNHAGVEVGDIVAVL